MPIQCDQPEAVVYYDGIAVNPQFIRKKNYAIICSLDRVSPPYSKIKA